MVTYSPGASSLCAPSRLEAYDPAQSTARWSINLPASAYAYDLAWDRAACCSSAPRNQRHLLHALREFETFYDGRRPHRALRSAAPLHPLPDPITDPDQITRLGVLRQDRLGGTLHEYRHAA